jgi:hypothetical protein
MEHNWQGKFALRGNAPTQATRSKIRAKLGHGCTAGKIVSALLQRTPLTESAPVAGAPGRDLRGDGLPEMGHRP